MKHKIHLVFLFVGLGIFSVFAQQEADRQTPQKVTEEEAERIQQELIDLLQTGKYFEAKNLYDTICVKVDSIYPFTESFYRMHIAGFENRLDSATFYLEEVIKKRFFPDIIYLSLYEIYVTDLQDYQKASQILDRVRAYLKQNPDSINAEEKKIVEDHLIELEEETTRRAAEPIIQIVRKNTKNSTPLLPDTALNTDHLFFNASYNGYKPIKTLFDTGVSEYILMDKAIAEETGVRKYPVYKNDTTYTMNGIKIPGYLGILDSMQIANITLYHLPVQVIDVKSMIRDTFETDALKKEKITNEFYELMKLSIGLKTMNLIGRIVIDQANNQLYFPMNNEKPESRKKKNIFRCEKRLFTQLKINDIPITALIDTKSNDYIRIDSNIYKKHKTYLPIDTLKAKKNYYRMIITGKQTAPFEIIVKEPVVMFTNKVIHPEKDDYVWISSFSQWGSFYLDMFEGTVGFPFLKRLGKKILFDFRNMRMEVVE